MEHYLLSIYLPRLILLLLEHYLLSTFTSSNPAAVRTLFTINIASSNPAAVGTLFTINIYLFQSRCCWNIIYYQYLPHLILLQLEHYLLSRFTSSNPAAVETLFTINFCLNDQVVQVPLKDTLL